MKEITHKSDHKYVIRKKQGKRQIKLGVGGVGSIGSQMRYNNEILHQKNIEDILSSLKEEIQSSDYVMVHSPGDNKYILFDEGKSLFDMKFKRNLRQIVLDTKRANYTELKRLHNELVKVYIISEEKLI